MIPRCEQRFGSPHALQARRQAEERVGARRQHRHADGDQAGDEERRVRASDGAASRRVRARYRIFGTRKERNDWWRAEGHRLTLADLGDVLDELPERLVVGTGANGRMRPGPAVVRVLARARRGGRGAADGRGDSPLRRTRPALRRRGAAPDLLMSEFALESSAFQHAGAIPTRHSCDGEDLSPPLRWRNVPERTRSLALVVDDPDPRAASSRTGSPGASTRTPVSSPRSRPRRATAETTSAPPAIAGPARRPATAATVTSFGSTPSMPHPISAPGRTRASWSRRSRGTC